MGTAGEEAVSAERARVIGLTLLPGLLCISLCFYFKFLLVLESTRCGHLCLCGNGHWLLNILKMLPFPPFFSPNLQYVPSRSRCNAHPKLTQACDSSQCFLPCHSSLVSSGHLLMWVFSFVFIAFFLSTEKFIKGFCPLPS